MVVNERTTAPARALLLRLLVVVLLVVVGVVRADVDDYRFLPTPSGGGHDVSYYINAVRVSPSQPRPL